MHHPCQRPKKTDPADWNREHEPLPRQESSATGGHYSIRQVSRSAREAVLTSNSSADNCTVSTTIRHEPVPDVDWLVIALDQDRGDEHLSTE
jgi:hypothetical protein